jgi:UDP-N-acetylglucosamine 1-carboxyvinyltransferase
VGEIVPQGAKNEALQIISAVLHTDVPITVSNIPDIRDVNPLIEILGALGVKIDRPSLDTCTFQADAIDLDYMATTDFLEMAAKLRDSIMLVGPLLARFGQAVISRPGGGDKIGRRRLDTHCWGFQQLGAEFKYEENQGLFRVSSKSRLKGKYMLLDEASGTANILMATVLAEGTTTIYNAACEPYVQQLPRMLVHMGAKIEGVGSNLLTIHGVKSLGGTKHRVLAEMIEVGSFIALAAMTQSEITIKNVDLPNLGLIPEASGEWA